MYNVSGLLKVQLLDFGYYIRKDLGSFRLTLADVEVDEAASFLPIQESRPQVSVVPPVENKVREGALKGAVTWRSLIQRPSGW